MPGLNPHGHTQAAGALLTAPGTAVLSAVLVLAVWFSQTGMAMLAGLFLGTAGLARLWCRLSLAGVQAERRFDCLRSFPGEPLTCTVNLANRKPLPLPWVQLEWSLPPEIRPQAPETEADSPGVRRSAALLGYRRMSWKIKLVAARRGLFPIGPLALRSGDIFGLFTRSRTDDHAGAIIVYPRIHPVDIRKIPSLYPMGDVQTQRRLVQDPSCPIGVRDYQSTDNLKFIHWKATARGRGLKVKQAAATTAYQVALVLDVASFQTDGVLAEEEFELGISVAGSIAAALAGHGSPVGLYANTRLADTGLPAEIPAGANRGRLTDLLEALAKVTASPSGALAGFVERQQKDLAAGTTLVFISGRPAETLPLLLAGLSRSGFKTLLITIGQNDEARLPDHIPRFRVRRPEDLGRPAGERT
ncbi:MAG: DUF58 domain-containing protein [Desulfobacterales bacterium]